MVRECTDQNIWLHFQMDSNVVISISKILQILQVISQFETGFIISPSSKEAGPFNKI